MFVAPRTISVSDLKSFVGGYHEGWKTAGHAGRGEISLNMPVYVAQTSRRARDEAEASTMAFYRTIAQALQVSDGAASQTTEAREGRAQRLRTMTYEEALREQVIAGDPEEVADRLSALRAEIGFSSLSAWMNPGGQIPHERVLTSMRLFAERVMPRVA
jgi:alkanesulfonate monooxygenase SsuD/methylene tetrahydromethanopterin reductase-like flavin-dependent oxidoreductase (luciferase family)